MSRRAIRDMLMGPPRRPMTRKWAVPAAMAAVLAVGLGLGVGLGLLAGHKPAPRPVVVAAADVVSPPPAVAGDDGPLVVAPTVVPPTGAPSPLARPEDRAAAGDGATRDAALIVPQPPVSKAGAPPPEWVRYAVPAPPVGGRPMIAVVIDDLGLDKRRTERVIALRGPLTLAFMTYAEDLDQQTEAAHAHGHELMVHMPMQPTNASLNAGPEVLEVGLPIGELRRRIEWGLSRFHGYVGINNHMGSRFTADGPGMEVVMRELAGRGLMFLDSVTTGKSVAAEVARQAGVPFAARQVFLDNTQTEASIRAQLDEVEQIARRHGSAIAIGHPHDATIAALSAWLPTLAAHGFALVPVTAIVEAGEPRG